MMAFLDSNMLFDSTIRQELSRQFVATMVVMVTVVMTIILIRTFGQASRGQVNPTEVSLVMGYTILGYFPSLMTMALFISCVGTLSRMYNDSEMVIWFSSGNGLMSFLKPILHFAWPYVLTVSLMALLVWPWANFQIQDLRQRFEKRGDLERVSPGEFQESANGLRVFFIDKHIVGDIGKSNVFIASTEKNKQSMTSSQSGRIETINNENYLILNNGQRLETDLATQEFKLSEFVEYGMQESNKGVLFDEKTTSAISTWDLIKNPRPTYLGELGWRISIGIAAFNFLLIGLAVAHMNPRAAKSSSMIYSLLIFLIYFNLINLCQAWVSAGKINIFVQILGLNGCVFLMAYLWLTQRNLNFSWKSLGKRVVTDPDVKSL